MTFKESYRLEKVYYQNIITMLGSLKSLKESGSADDTDKISNLLDSAITEGESIVLIYKNIGELYAEIANQIQKILDMLKELRDDIEDLKRRVEILEGKVAAIEQQIISIQGDIENLYLTKQDKLIAGDNITIDGNVISATAGGDSKVFSIVCKKFGVGHVDNTKASDIISAIKSSEKAVFVFEDLSEPETPRYYIASDFEYNEEAEPNIVSFLYTMNLSNKEVVRNRVTVNVNVYENVVYTFLQSKLYGVGHIDIDGSDITFRPFVITYNPNDSTQNTSAQEIAEALEWANVFLFNYVGAHKILIPFGFGVASSGLVTFSYIFEVYSADELHYVEVNVRNKNYQIGDRVVQRKLTAGSNITIDANNVISATGGGQDIPEIFVDIADKLFTAKDNTLGSYYEIQPMYTDEDRIVALHFTMCNSNGEPIYSIDCPSYEAISEALDAKQDKLVAGDNIVISTSNVISAVFDAYTKAETDALLANKQDKLTAGDNIEITPTNVISAGIGFGIEYGVTSYATVLEKLNLNKDLSITAVPGDVDSVHRIANGFVDLADESKIKLYEIGGVEIGNGFTLITCYEIASDDTYNVVKAYCPTKRNGEILKSGNWFYRILPDEYYGARRYFEAWCDESIRFAIDKQSGALWRSDPVMFSAVPEDLRWHVTLLNVHVTATNSNYPTSASFINFADYGTGKYVRMYVCSGTERNETYYECNCYIFGAIGES